MSRVISLIETIEIELLKKGKNYFTLTQANKILFEKGKISKEEMKCGYLKSLLVSNQIINASQTESKPRQWRIFLPQEKIQKKDIYNSTYKEEKSYQLHRNKKIKKANYNSLKWIFGGAIFLFVIYISNLKNTNDIATGSNYVITDFTYAATNKENFDKMFEYFSVNDGYAVNLMILNGQVKTLEKGIDVILIENHYSYSIIREKNFHNNLWVVTDHIGR
jgi:hypothetical protein